MILYRWNKYNACERRVYLITCLFFNEEISNFFFFIIACQEDRKIFSAFLNLFEYVWLDFKYLSKLWGIFAQ